MNEDFNVTQAGHFGMEHRSLEIKRCANGYIVRYSRVRLPAEKNDILQAESIREQRVFINNADMVDFVRKYYQDEPNP